MPAPRRPPADGRFPQRPVAGRPPPAGARPRRPVRRLLAAPAAGGRRRAPGAARLHRGAARRGGRAPARAAGHRDRARSWRSCTARTSRSWRPGGSCSEVIAGGRIALVLAFEGMEPVGGDLAVLDAFFRLGVRIASFTWNRRTQFADGAGENDTGGRLTRLGVAAVAAHGAHGHDRGRQPPLGSRAVARRGARPAAVRRVAIPRAARSAAHPRNLPDEGAARHRRRPAASSASTRSAASWREQDATVDDFIRHIRHAVDIVGRGPRGPGHGLRGGPVRA